MIEPGCSIHPKEVPVLGQPCLACYRERTYGMPPKQPRRDADVTGLMAKPIPGWEGRVREGCRAEYFAVETEPQGFSVRVTDELWRRLDPEEQTRMTRKLALVAKAAGYMARGMLKGTLKYATDHYDVSQWVAHVVGEGADQFNYALLLADAYERFMDRS